MHCGWIERDKWTEATSLPERMGPASSPVQVREMGQCPGSLVRLRAVSEATQAKVALESGALTSYFPGEEAAVLEGAMQSMAAFNAHEVERVRKAAAK